MNSVRCYLAFFFAFVQSELIEWHIFAPTVAVVLTLYKIIATISAKERRAILRSQCLVGKVSLRCNHFRHPGTPHDFLLRLLVNNRNVAFAFLPTSTSTWLKFPGHQSSLLLEGHHFIKLGFLSFCISSELSSFNLVSKHQGRAQCLKIPILNLRNHLTLRRMLARSVLFVILCSRAHVRELCLNVELESRWTHWEQSVRRREESSASAKWYASMTSVCVYPVFSKPQLLWRLPLKRVDSNFGQRILLFFTVVACACIHPISSPSLETWMILQHRVPLLVRYIVRMTICVDWFFVSRCANGYVSYIDRQPSSAEPLTNY